VGVTVFNVSGGANVGLNSLGSTGVGVVTAVGNGLLHGHVTEGDGEVGAVSVTSLQ